VAEDELEKRREKKETPYVQKCPVKGCKWSLRVQDPADGEVALMIHQQDERPRK